MTSNPRHDRGGRAARGIRWLLVASVAIVVAALGSSTAAAAHPPPLPDCFKTGSGYGSCEGMVIPGGGTVIKVTVADKKDEFKLTGPAPLQHTKAVACGDLGCIYNHLNWYVGNGATVVHGCQPNESTCDVDVSPGSTQWAVVYVRQNNDDKTLWAIWNSGKKKHASLAVKVTPDVASGSIGVGDTTAVKVKVTAVNGPVKEIDLGDGLTASGDAVKITSKPGGLKGFSLGADASRVFTYQVRGDNDGKAKLSASAAGKTSAGQSVHGSDSTTLDVTAKALSIRIVTVPSRIDLDIDDKGKIDPGEVTTKVVISNKSDAKIEGVQLLSLDPEPADPTQQLDKLRFPAGSFPWKIGTIGPKDSVTQTFKLKVTGDGKYQFRALALYDDGAARGGNGRAVGTGGDFESVVSLLYYSAHREDDNVTEKGNGAAFVTGGTTWYISAEIKNESSYQHLCVLPMAPSLSGNAAATGPTNIAEKSVRAFGGPFADALAPGQKVSLEMFVDTSPTGSTRGTVTLDPSVVKIAPDGKCQQKAVEGLKPLDAAEKTIKPFSTEFEVHVDQSAELKAPSGTFANTVNFFGGIAQQVFVDTFEQIMGIFALNNSVRSTIDEYNKEIGFYPAAIAYAVTLKAGQLIYTAGDVYAAYWRTASQTEKDSFYYRVGNVVANVTDDFFGDAKQEIKQAAEPFMAELEQAYATGDDARVWHLWGQLSGHVVQQALTMVFMEALGAKIAKAAPELEATAKAAGEEWEAKAATQAAEEGTLAPETALEEVPPGTELKPRDITLWGEDAAADADFARISKDCECLIGVRGRARGSVAKLEQGSVWKHENLKPKNVNDIDIDWLGFRKADAAEVRFRTYTPEQEAAIRQRIEAASLPADEKTAILDRFETRLGEKKYISKIEGFSKKGQINVGFNYRDNGIGRPSTSVLRKFDLQSAAIPAEEGIPAGGTYYTPYQENPKYASLARSGGKLPADCIEKLLSVLCTVTGDMDGVYVTTLQGGAIPSDKMVKIYKLLQEAGWQHPETLTWINDEGQFFFGSKEKILRGLEQNGGEAMIEYAPDGVRRATYLNLDQSSLLSRDNFRLRVVGGYTDFVKAGG